MNGWMTMRCGVEGMLLLTLAITATADNSKPTEDAPVDAELLEFLGLWETTDGEWFDPLPEVALPEQHHPPKPGSTEKAHGQDE